MEKKWWAWTLVIAIVVIAIILVVVFIFSAPGQTNQIEKTNKYIYLFLKCQSECPITNLKITENTSVQISDQKCISDCKEYYDSIPAGFKNFEYPSSLYPSLLYHSNELQNCREIGQNTNSLEQVNSCMQIALPKLKDEFGIVV